MYERTLNIRHPFSLPFERMVVCRMCYRLMAPSRVGLANYPASWQVDRAEQSPFEVGGAFPGTIFHRNSLAEQDARQNLRKERLQKCSNFVSGFVSRDYVAFATNTSSWLIYYYNHNFSESFGAYTTLMLVPIAFMFANSEILTTLTAYYYNFLERCCTNAFLIDNQHPKGAQCATKLRNVAI